MKTNLTILAFLLVFTSANLFSQTKDSEKIQSTFHSISSHELLEYAEELSSDKFGGRLSGSPEYIDAAKWCAEKFKEWEIQPANENSYFQYFKNEFSEVNSTGKLVYSSQKNKAIHYRFPEDYLPGSNSCI